MLRQFILFIPGVFFLLGCTGSRSDGNLNEVSGEAVSKPVFTISVEPLSISDPVPSLHSFAWARQGNEVLLIGGRLDGFHGLSERDTVFRSSKANNSIWVIDFDDFSYYELPFNPDDPSMLHFSSSNMSFCQDGDTLFFAGGYGRQNVTDYQSNYTFDQITSVQVSEMINQVKLGASGNPSSAVLGTARSPFVQVSGGEMERMAGIFYLMFGQNYKGTYQTGLTGTYTSAVRRFRFADGSISDTLSLVNASLKRRDLNVEVVNQANGNFFAGYGGVFTSNDGGFVNPVKIFPNDGDVFIVDDTTTQITNQYDCARISVYDQASDVNTHVFLGGIGKYQYDVSTRSWEDGDNGAKLPFVKTITQMVWQNGIVQQHIQLPPGQAELPELIGTNALFLADQAFVLEGNTIDMGKLSNASQPIGWFYGGIQSQKPTSSMIYPTEANRTIYQVFLNRTLSGEEQ
jgi:hypothetical protein